MWIPPFVCPECRTPLDAPNGDALDCSCGCCFTREGGIYRFLSPERRRTAEPFLRQYRLVRERDGYRAVSPDYYRMLPIVTPRDPRAAEWRIRRESYARFQQHAFDRSHRLDARVLDLGAGSGWLSHRLASFGLRPVAVDRLDDEHDGLGACRHYPVPFPAVQADFDALPFAADSFDVVVLNGSLHYAADPGRTLAEARRVLVPGGALAVMDSPMFHRETDGQRMLDDQRRAFTAEYGLSDVVSAGIGYLTFARLQQAARDLSLQSRFFPSHGPLAWRARRQLARWRLGRAPAAFGVWMAR